MGFRQVLKFSMVRFENGFDTQKLLDFNAKREHAIIILEDLPNLVQDYAAREMQRFPDNPEVRVYDSRAGIRITSACEALCNALYGAGELASKCCTRVMKPQLPESFRKIKDKIEKGSLADRGFRAEDFDFSGYKVIHSIRTELTHYSSIFLAGTDDTDPIIHVQKLSEDMKQTAIEDLRVSELIKCARSSIRIFDRFLEGVLIDHIIPNIDHSRKITGQVERDERGMPIIKDAMFVPKPDISVQQHIIDCGYNSPE